MTGSPGEMPFLDHLEELRWRILRSLGAIVVGFGTRPLAGAAVPARQSPQAADRAVSHRPGGKLVVTSPTEPVMIVFKLGFLVGLVLASPVILWQLWAFLAPALYAREKRALVPALFVGLLLFLTGAARGLRLRRAAGAAGAVQLPDRGDPAVHHLRRLFRLRAAGRAGAGDLVRAAAGHHHPGVARGDQRRRTWPGSAGTRWSPRSSPGPCCRRAPTSSR